MTPRYSVKKILRFYWQHVWRYPRYVWGIFISLPLTVLMSSYLPPIVLATVINRLANNHYDPHNLWGSFHNNLFVYILLLVGGAVGWRVIDAFQWRLEANVERDIAERVYSHLLDQSANFHANTFGGSLVSQTNKLLGSYIRFADTLTYQVLQLVAGLIFTIIILAPRAPLFVVAFFLFSVLYMSSAFFVTKKVRAMNAIQAQNESKQTGYLADSVTNIMAIKSFAGGRHERRQFAKAANLTREGTLGVMRANQKTTAYFSILNRVIMLAALLTAIISVAIFGANVATAFLIFTYTMNLVEQLFVFSNNSLRSFNRSFGDAQEMVEILQLQPEIKDPVKPEKSRITNGQITFKDVTFQHEGAGQVLFEGLNLNIKAGEKIGLVGHSGAGKTTITRILLRFSDLLKGEILIDGQNIAHLTQDDLRKHIAYVPQEPIMFHRSLFENIRYGKFEASDEEVLAVSKMAHAHEFIEQLPQGYETLVGERGVKLSGGQRQRVAIARAMIKDAPVILLDEATSALDSESEVLIQDALWKLIEGRTTIVIAHRLSTIQRMDRIIVMDEGRVVEEGPHKELLELGGIYSQLWAHQSGGFIED